MTFGSGLIVCDSEGEEPPTPGPQTAARKAAERIRFSRSSHFGTALTNNSDHLLKQIKGKQQEQLGITAASFPDLIISDYRYGDASCSITQYPTFDGMQLISSLS